MDNELYKKLRDVSKAEQIMDLTDDELSSRYRTVLSLLKSSQDQNDLIYYEKKLAEIEQEMKRRGLEKS